MPPLVINSAERRSLENAGGKMAGSDLTESGNQMKMDALKNKIKLVMEENHSTLLQCIDAIMLEASFNGVVSVGKFSPTEPLGSPTSISTFSPPGNIFSRTTHVSDGLLSSQDHSIRSMPHSEPKRSPPPEELTVKAANRNSATQRPSLRERLRLSSRQPTDGKSIGERLMISSSNSSNIVQADHSTQADIPKEGDENQASVVNQNCFSGCAPCVTIRPPLPSTGFARKYMPGPGIFDLVAAKGWHKDVMKQRVSMAAEQNKLNGLTQLQKMVMGPWFNSVFAVLILVNAVMIGVEVDISPKSKDLFMQMEVFFAMAFTAEIVLRCFAMKPVIFVADPWNLFDLAIVICSLVDFTMFVLNTTQSQGNFLVLRIAKILRFVRCVRAMRIRIFHELRLIVHSVLFSVKFLIWAIGLLGIGVYVFTIIFLQAVQQGVDQVDNDAKIYLNKWFSSVFRTMLTLFQAILGGVSWGDLSMNLNKIHWAYEILLGVFVAMNLLVLLNVITGIVVDSAIQSAHHDRDNLIQDQVSQAQSVAAALNNIFFEADKEGDGEISFRDLEDYLKDERVKAYLHSLGVEVSEAWGLFRLLDIDGNGLVNREEFTMGCLRLKGPAKSVDVATLMYENKRMINTIVKLVSRTERSIKSIWQVVSENQDRSMRTTLASPLKCANSLSWKSGEVQTPVLPPAPIKKPRPIQMMKVAL